MIMLRWICPTSSQLVTSDKVLYKCGCQFLTQDPWSPQRQLHRIDPDHSLPTESHEDMWHSFPSTSSRALEFSVDGSNPPKLYTWSMKPLRIHGQHLLGGYQPTVSRLDHASWWKPQGPDTADSHPSSSEGILPAEDRFHPSAWNSPNWWFLNDLNDFPFSQATLVFKLMYPKLAPCSKKKVASFLGLFQTCGTLVRMQQSQNLSPTPELPL